MASFENYQVSQEKKHHKTNDEFESKTSKLATGLRNVRLYLFNIHHLKLEMTFEKTKNSVEEMESHLKTFD